jgi:hypothetical protein
MSNLIGEKLDEKILSLCNECTKDIYIFLYNYLIKYYNISIEKKEISVFNDNKIIITFPSCLEYSLSVRIFPSHEYPIILFYLKDGLQINDDIHSYNSFSKLCETITFFKEIIKTIFKLRNEFKECKTTILLNEFPRTIVISFKRIPIMQVYLQCKTDSIGFYFEIEFKRLTKGSIYFEPLKKIERIDSFEDIVLKIRMINNL